MVQPNSSVASELVCHSQFGQDSFLDQHVFRGKSNGFFLDIGAYDGVTYSNTLAFEANRSWNGICLEPNPSTFKRLAANRKCRCIQACVTEKRGDVEFVCGQGNSGAEMLSGFSLNEEQQDRIRQEGGTMEKVRVPCLTMPDIVEMEKITNVDYCSIDAEGYELAILRAFDFTRITPLALTVEENGQYPAIRRLLYPHGYRLVEKLGADLVLVHNSLASQLGSLGLLNPMRRYRKYANAALGRVLRRISRR